MINKRIFLLLLIFIMIICSGKCYKVNEHFILNRSINLNDIDNKLNSVISRQNELSNKHNELSNKQNKIAYDDIIALSDIFKEKIWRPCSEIDIVIDKQYENEINSTQERLESFIPFK